MAEPGSASRINPRRWRDCSGAADTLPSAAARPAPPFPAPNPRLAQLGRSCGFDRAAVGRRRP